MDLKFSFSWIGLIVFALPMLINIAYVLFPPADQPAETAPITRWVEWMEKISRIAYLAAIVLLAIFPVIYYLCAALWLHNLPAAALMIIFGAAHLTVSLQSFRKS